jgi:hypothetical protein
LLYNVFFNVTIANPPLYMAQLSTADYCMDTSYVFIINFDLFDGGVRYLFLIDEIFLIKCRDLYKLGQKINAEDVRQFVYRDMDLNLMEQKVLESSYRCMEEFYADAKTILHNCYLAFGGLFIENVFV